MPSWQEGWSGSSHNKAACLRAGLSHRRLLATSGGAKCSNLSSQAKVPAEHNSNIHAVTVGLTSVKCCNAGMQLAVVCVFDKKGALICSCSAFLPGYLTRCPQSLVLCSAPVFRMGKKRAAQPASTTKKAGRQLQNTNSSHQSCTTWAEHSVLAMSMLSSITPAQLLKGSEAGKGLQAVSLLEGLSGSLEQLVAAPVAAADEVHAWRR